MASFKQPDFIERQEAAAKARKVALEKFRAKAADPALAERLTARAARGAERSAIKTTREIERAEKDVREAERAQQAERDAAIEAAVLDQAGNAAEAAAAEITGYKTYADLLEALDTRRKQS
jgi:hypothetical protein